MVPGMGAGGATVPAGRGVDGPEGRLYNIVAVAFIFAISVVDGAAPSSLTSAINVAASFVRTNRPRSVAARMNGGSALTASSASLAFSMPV